MTLTGTVTGNAKTALQEAAEREARTYYQQECVRAVLSNEQSTPNRIESTTFKDRFPTYETIPHYTATYEAEPGCFYPIHGVCIKCGKDKA